MTRRYHATVSLTIEGSDVTTEVRGCVEIAGSNLSEYTATVVDDPDVDLGGCWTNAHVLGLSRHDHERIDVALCEAALDDVIDVVRDEEESETWL